MKVIDAVDLMVLYGELNLISTNGRYSIKGIAVPSKIVDELIQHHMISEQPHRGGSFSTDWLLTSEGQFWATIEKPEGRLKFSEKQSMILEALLDGKSVLEEWVHEHDRYEYTVGDERLIGLGNTISSLLKRDYLKRERGLLQLTRLGRGAAILSKGVTKSWT